MTHPDQTKAMGMVAHHHAMDYYSWDVKALKTLETYEWVIGQKTDKPDFWNQAISQDISVETVQSSL